MPSSNETTLLSTHTRCAVESKGALPGSVEANTSGIRAAGEKTHSCSNRTRRENEVSDNPMFLYAGEYESVEDARRDRLLSQAQTERPGYERILEQPGRRQIRHR